ncbi:hypothetical protein CXG81DRAFT_25013 [Caulochytrium protostelioides]|uniref:Gaa1-domain-containing protein n=1 Tax=Caulochytrium protostelioides TaxID=1555241 RepID=A0A4V1IUZ9_9FUNG|nr:hypothetical protein CXG81DRAFT_25013 [Caulochytrium protostelioides]|eukprot:RKP02319.1 hypothetical protein CXG81DRAFT_25013 [Caulochytrium protostelioides]
MAGRLFRLARSLLQRRGAAPGSDAAAKAGPTPAVAKAKSRELTRIQRRRAFTRVILRGLVLVVFLCYLVGAVWIMVFPADVAQRRFNIDENAILVNQANRYMNHPDMDLWKAARYDFHTMAEDGSFRDADRTTQRIERFIRDAYFEPVRQDFRVPHRNITGTNLYFRLNAPRGDGTEVLLLSAPRLVDGRFNGDGVAHLIAFANYARRQNWWAKDLIFLVPDHASVGTQAWLEAYHGDANPLLPAEPYEGPGGLILVAINLAFPEVVQEYNALGLFPIGLNGRLPNADLLLTLVQACHGEHVHPALHAPIAARWSATDPWHRYGRAARQLGRWTRIQALGYPTGEHAMYQRYLIEAATLRGYLLPADTPGVRVFSNLAVARMIEISFRAFNNLLERLHHSFWFYLMTGSDIFIPLSMYIPGIVLPIVALLLWAAYMWARVGDNRRHRQHDGDADADAVADADGAPQKQQRHSGTDGRETDASAARDAAAGPADVERIDPMDPSTRFFQRPADEHPFTASPRPVITALSVMAFGHLVGLALFAGLQLPAAHTVLQAVEGAAVAACDAVLPPLQAALPSLEMPREAVATAAANAAVTLAAIAVLRHACRGAARVLRHVLRDDDAVLARWDGPVLRAARRYDLCRCLLAAELSLGLLALATLNPSLSGPLALLLTPLVTQSRVRASLGRPRALWLQSRVQDLVSPIVLCGIASTWAGVPVSRAVQTAVDHYALLRVILWPFMTVFITSILASLQIAAMTF